MQDALNYLLIVHNNTPHDIKDLVVRMAALVKYSRESVARDIHDASGRKCPEAMHEVEVNFHVVTALNILISQLRKELQEKRDE